MLGTMFKVLSGYYLIRAALRGPRALGAFLVRRQVRRVVNRRIRRIR